MTIAMDAERWQRVREVFGEALELPADERSAYLECACADDEALRREVERLLVSLTEADDFLEEPAVDKTWGNPAHDLYLDRQIGAYRLVERIGRGGMGVVYLATRSDDVFEKKVAIKLLPASGASEELVRRFRAERQILARLEHSNIARLLDGGTAADGLPYLVMEYVDGLAIDEYCDLHGLGVRRRLELFCGVCSAIHFAHQHLVVHRDVKPSNVLVTAEGVPKLLDFGIAKLLQPELAPQALGPRAPGTATAQRILTPKYASPEQIEGAAITTASDVYSLGVLLYKLLGGRLPYSLETDSVAELVRAICDEEPRPLVQDQPAKLRRSLTGDVENIVAKALRKEPQKRYNSAQQLAEDIRNHLEGRPILARRGGFAYKARKFVGRNPWAVGATAALIVSALIFGAVMAFQHSQITLERDRAERVIQYLVDLFETPDPFAASPADAGADLPAREILERGAARLDEKFGDQPELQARLKLTLGKIHRRLGLSDDARKLLEEAIAENREIGSERHQLKLAESLYEFGLLERVEGHRNAAISLLQESLAIRRRLPDQETAIAGTLGTLGVLYTERGDYSAGEPLLNEALEIRTELYGELDLEVAKSINDLAVLYQQAGRFPEAERHFERALAIRRGLLKPSHPYFAGSLNNLAGLYLSTGKFEKAEPIIAESLELYRETLGDEHPWVAIVLSNLARAREALGRFAEAEPAYREALGHFRRLHGDEHPHVATVLANFAHLLTRMGDDAEAEELFRESLAIRRQLFEGDHPDLAEGLDHLGWFLHRERGEARAEALLVEALEMRRRLFDARHPQIAQSLRHLGQLYFDRGDLAAAEPLAREARDILAELFEPGDERLESVEELLRQIETALGAGFSLGRSVKSS